jgi:hypothetical protein
MRTALFDRLKPESATADLSVVQQEYDMTSSLIVFATDLG